MSDTEIPDEIKRRHVVNAADARDQASEGAYSFLRSEFRKTKDGEEFEIPHKDLFDNDQQDRWDDLIADMLTYDREPDVTNDQGAVLVKGRLVIPHHKKNKRVTPSWAERLAIVVWGEDGAKRAKAGGIIFNEIEVVWAKQDMEMQRRRREDLKSVGGGSGVASTSD